MTRIVYLHGFASSPQSGKAQFFRRRFEERGLRIEIPQLDQGDFTSLTITSQLEVIERVVGDAPAILMGSSLGGYLAALYASRHEAVKKLVLMAPAFRFPKRWRERYSEQQIEQWRRRGTLPVYHYAYDEQRPLGYAIVEDAPRYEAEPEVSQPALILHGTWDEVVPVTVSREYASHHANVTLREFASGHALNDVVEDMWTEVAEFLFQNP
jgi:uncharacterized protein